MTPLNYTPKRDHRNNSPQKSQWTISREEEKRCFYFMQQNNWRENNCGWSVHLIVNSPNYLGVGVRRDRRLFIAKFIDGNTNGNWHGYPADYEANNHDVPPVDVLCNWKERGFVNYAKIRKIIKQQPCKL